MSLLIQHFYYIKHASAIKVTSILVECKRANSLNKQLSGICHLKASSFSRDEVGGICPGVVCHWVCQMVIQVLDGTLSGDNSLNEESKH